MRDAGEEILAAGRASLRRTRWMSLVAVAAAGVWWVWPLDRSVALLPEKSEIGETSSNDANASVAGSFNEPAFAARLWVPPTRPVETVVAAPPPPPAPPPAFTLKLAGIERSGDTFVALLYDPAALKVARLAAGESMGRYRAESIDEAGAVLVDTQYPGRPVHTLRLRSLGEPRTPLRVVRGTGEERTP